MKYVSARWVNPPQGIPGSPTIKAGEDSDVPPWPEYLTDGGTIAPAGPNVAQQILEVPDTLTGGPTIEEVFNGNV